MSLIPYLRGFKFGSKHNKDFNVAMESKTISFPSKKKVKDSVPFMNGEYDFSTIGANGEITYENREIKIVLGFPAANKEKLQVMYSNVLEWLVDSGKQQLIFDEIHDYYFVAEVESNSSLEEIIAYGKLEIIFTALPFKYSVDYVGNDIWDTFNFEEDYAQDVNFTINGNKTITIYKPGRNVRPTIYSSSNMSMTYNGKTYNLTSGNNNIYGFYLTQLENKLTFSGTGTIKFIFRKEVL